MFAMRIGVSRMTFRLAENDNLKGKRKIVRSIISRLREKFNISVAEIGDNDQWKTLTLGLTCISNDGRHANSMMSNAVRFAERISGDLELLDYELEVLDGP